MLLEMRPALEGFAGIPQETRLLFRGIRMLGSFEVEGLIQTSRRSLSRGTQPASRRRWFSRSLSDAKRIDRYSRVVISLMDKPFRTVIDRAATFFESKLQTSALTFRTILGGGGIRLTEFRSQYFEDFVWRSMFSKTLPASDYALITSANQKICSVPWRTMHMVGLKSLSVMPTARYPRVDTAGAEVFIAQTPYPGVISRNTSLVVRYHDAIPVFMPHTIPDKSDHQATHFHALMSNVRSGGWFACVSDATRSDLLRLFPEAASRSVTIHNMVSHHYFPEESDPALIPGIIRSRLYEGDPGKQMFLKPKFLSLREQEGFYQRHLGAKPLRYLLMVSTIEPRKNHARLLAAWEVLKAEVDPDLKLVVVGALGWDYNSIFDSFRTWIDRGQLFSLSAVPAPDLRVLYRHAVATVCPSLGEGFDFSGVEAMRSGGVVIASDIPVHREVYDEASEYFDPYATSSLVKALKKVLYGEQAADVQAALRRQGAAVSSRYLPEVILPKWQSFLDRVIESRHAGQILPEIAPVVRREEVVRAFRELLGRDPENEVVVQAHQGHPSVAELDEVIKSSPEYAERLQHLQSARALADAAITRALAPDTGERPLMPAVREDSSPSNERAELALTLAAPRETLLVAGARPVEVAAAGLGATSLTGGGALAGDFAADGFVPASRSDVVAAYRELLGREPEGEAAIQAHLQHGSVAALEAAIRVSSEFVERRARIEAGREREGRHSDDIELVQSQPDPSGLDRPVCPDDVVAAFHELLGRAPESDDVVRAHLRLGTVSDLRSAIATSPECRMRQQNQGVAPRWVATDVLGQYTMWVDLNDRFVSKGCLQDAWESEETDFFRSRLAADQVVLDIGANVGWYSLVAARELGGSGIIHAFEPRPDTAKMLRRTVADNRLEERIKVWELALDDHDGVTGLAWEPGSSNPGHSFLESPGGGYQGGPAVELARVRAAMLDSVLPDLLPDVVKIDVEGAEPRVIAGAQEALRRRKPIVLSELFPEQLKAVSRSSPAAYIGLMEVLGYHCFLLEKGRPGRRLKDFPSDAKRELVSVVFEPVNRR